MHEKQAKFVRFGVAVLATMAVAVGLSGQGSRQLKASMKSAWIGRHALTVARAALERATPGAPQDWSHRHLIFSNPGPEENAIQNGRYDSWLQITNDPRFIIQQKVRAAGPKILIDRDESAIPETVATVGGLGTPPLHSGPPSGSGRGPSGKVHRDWAIGLGTGTTSQVSSPAKWSFDTTTANCANDFVVYPTGAAGGAGQASIIAYFNLYTGCGGTVPSVAWAFNTGGTITGAPAFSIDGKQLAFIQATGGVATLVLLKLPLTLPGTGSLGTPTTLATTQTPTTYPTCTAPCMLRFTLNGSPADTWSNPWIDYSSDTLFVGDNVGKLHRFSPVFSGTAGTPAAETVVATVWPVTLDATPIASPVYDPGTGKVFVGSGGGFFYAIGAGTPGFGLTSGHIYGSSTRLGPAAQTTVIEDGPIVDSAAGMAYITIQQDTAGTTNNAVVQFSTGFTNSSGTKTTIGTFGRTSEPVLSGAFDNIYFNSESACNSGCTPTGSLYVAGHTSVSAVLYQIPITANVMGAAHIGPTIGDSGFFGRSSPVTEFFNTNGLPATATVTISGNPGGFAPWGTGTRAVTLGTVKYTFVTGAPGASTATAVQVRIFNSSFTTATNEDNTAANLAAAINADSTLCGSTPPCFGTGTAANASATAAIDGTNLNQVDLTATVGGTGGNFTVSNSGGTTTGITVSAVTSGGSRDVIFLSTYSSANNGCNTGCVYSYDVTAGTTMTGATTPFATLPVTANIANADGYATGGIVVDNDVASATLGVAQVYFLSLDNASGVTCSTSGSRICATQASQSGLD